MDGNHTLGAKSAGRLPHHALPTCARPSCVRAEKVARLGVSGGQPWRGMAVGSLLTRLPRVRLPPEAISSKHSESSPRFAVRLSTVLGTCHPDTNVLQDALGPAPPGENSPALCREGEARGRPPGARATVHGEGTQGPGRKHRAQQGLGTEAPVLRLTAPCVQKLI